MTNTTKVLFRKWLNGEVIALMPYVPADVNGIYSDSYEHVGQHGAADAEGLIGRTVPAIPSEFAALKRELESIGYAIEVIQRIPRNASNVRRAAARGAK